MMRVLGSLLLLVGLSPLAGAHLHGQAGRDGNEGVHWLASAHYLHYQLRDQADWSAITLLAGRVAPPSTVLLEVEVAERAGIREHTLGTDLYLTLGRAGYVNVRGRVSPGAETVPRVHAGANLFRTLRGGWEGWVGYDHRSYPLETVRTFGVGPGVYVGPWYLRGRPSASWGRGETAVVGKFLARRLFEDSPTDYLELGAGYGREFVELVPAAGDQVVIAGQRTWLVSARTQVYLTPRVGVAGGGVYQTYRFLGPRPSFTVGMLGRL